MTIADKYKTLKFRGWMQFLTSVSAILFLAYICSLMRVRIDLTEDKRYTLSAPGRKVLSAIKNDIFIQVYLDGEIPIPLKRLKRSVREMLDEFRLVSGRKIDYEFINPLGVVDPKQRETSE
jgi:ABC-2 type transport system permease protein